MPKITEYPVESFDKVMALANAVNDLGGSCTIKSCAEKLKKKVSGGFGMLISSSIKHDLIIRKGEILAISDLYKKIKFSNNDANRAAFMLSSFLNPVLYSKIYEEFEGKELTVNNLNQILVMKLEVEETKATIIAKNFMQGAKKLGLLSNGVLTSTNNLILSNSGFNANIELDKNEFELTEKPLNKNINTFILDKPSDKSLSTTNGISSTLDYKWNISGPEMEVKLSIKDVDDLLILESIINKLRKELKK